MDEKLVVGHGSCTPYERTLYNKLLIPKDADLKKEIAVEITLACKGCEYQQNYIMKLPVNFSEWKCKACGNSNWLPMLVEMKVSELPVLKSIGESLSDRDVAYDEKTNEYSFEVGV